MWNEMLVRLSTLQPIKAARSTFRLSGTSCQAVTISRGRTERLDPDFGDLRLTFLKWLLVE